jgi:hypothetical protein
MFFLYRFIHVKGNLYFYIFRRFELKAYTVKISHALLSEDVTPKMYESLLEL